MKQPSSRKFEATVGFARTDRFKEGVYPVVLSVLAVLVIFTAFFLGTHFLLGIASTLIIFGVVAGGANCIKAGALRDSNGKPKAFTLGLGSEVVTLYPGITWGQVDRYKWSARGLIDEPQLFHVLPNGTIEINSERICLTDPAGIEKLGEEINRRHATTVAEIAKSLASEHAAIPAMGPAVAEKVCFKVRLDRFHHMIVEYALGREREETGLRGIPALIANGLMARPQNLHIDPMQRAIEIDDVRYECTEAGARQFEKALNTRYVPPVRSNAGVGIEVRENPASNTGFDIRFMTLRAGIPFEVKDHLSQENLDVLTDSLKCDILKPGIQLRLSPPYLVIRRRRPDMGEDKIVGLPDLNYLQTTAAELQRILNHPLICRDGGAASQPAETAAECLQEITTIRVVRNSANKSQLSLECLTADGRVRETKALTHHNVAELQHGGSFLPHLDICLSLDHQVLSILNKQTDTEQRFAVGTNCSDEELATAGRMLTVALKSPSAKPVKKSGPIRVDTQLAAKAFATATIAKAPKRDKSPAQPAAVRAETNRKEAPPAQAVKTGIAALFQETDPVRINQEIFHKLAAHFEVEIQEAHFSLPPIFEDRRFEILNFCEGEIESLMELRGEEFCGFYIAHINEEKQVLVYACNGAHIEWRPERCMLQPSAEKEAEDYPTSALLGLALDRNEEIVFVVQRAFKEWIKPREQHYSELLIHFKTVAELAAAPGEYNLIWPRETTVVTAGLPLIEPPRQTPRI